jgi:hypothetical protein
MFVLDGHGSQQTGRDGGNTTGRKCDLLLEIVIRLTRYDLEGMFTGRSGTDFQTPIGTHLASGLTVNSDLCSWKRLDDELRRG